MLLAELASHNFLTRYVIMTLNSKDLFGITFGALNIVEDDGYISFERFKQNQFDYYEKACESSYKRALHSASMVIDFTTDSENLSFAYKVSDHASRSWYSFDIYENDMMILHHTGDATEAIEGEITAKLSRGMKRVRVYFPFSVKTYITKFTLDDGAAIISTQRKLNALVLGDSITQGYDGKYPSLHYVNQMVERYSMNYVNQAIGGEHFNENILDDIGAFTPDVITLAMGINDWASYQFDEIEKNADKYFSRLTEIYKDVPIIYISPIWINREGNDTTLLPTIEMLESVASSYGAHVIHGLDLVPHDAGMFSDGVHPSDLGFTESSKKLFPQIDKIIDFIKKAKEEKEIGLSVL